MACDVAFQTAAIVELGFGAPYLCFSTRISGPRRRTARLAAARRIVPVSYGSWLGKATGRALSRKGTETQVVSSIVEAYALELPGGESDGRHQRNAAAQKSRDS